MPHTSLGLLTPFLTGPDPSWTGKKTLRDVYVTVGGHDVTGYIFQVEVSMAADEIDVTCMDIQEGTRCYAQGQMHSTFRLGLLSGDWTLNGILQSAYDSGGTVNVVVQPHFGNIGEGNPQWSADCHVKSYFPWSGDVGSRAEASLELLAAEPTTTLA